LTSQRQHNILISPVGELSTELIEAVAAEIKAVKKISTTNPVIFAATLSLCWKMKLKN